MADPDLSATWLVRTPIHDELFDVILNRPDEIGIIRTIHEAENTRTFFTITLTGPSDVLLEYVTGALRGVYRGMEK